MTAKIISGTETAKAIREELKIEVDELREKHNVVPGLVTILVGEDPASQSYVAAKNKTAHALGIHSEQVTLDADTGEQELLDLVDIGHVGGGRIDTQLFGILIRLDDRFPLHLVVHVNVSWQRQVESQFVLGHARRRGRDIRKKKTTQ